MVEHLPCIKLRDGWKRMIFTSATVIYSHELAGMRKEVITCCSIFCFHCCLQLKCSFSIAYRSSVIKQETVTFSMEKIVLQEKTALQFLHEA